MSLHLGIETSTSVCSVAIFDQSEIIVSQTENEDRSHSSLLTIMIDNALKGEGLKFADLDGVVVSDGPGSYTGLRIGASVAKAICFCHKIPLRTVGGLLACAHRGLSESEDNHFVVGCSDARRDDVYIHIVDKKGSIVEGPEMWGIENDLIPYVENQPERSFVVVGEGRSKVFGKNTPKNLKRLDIGHDASNLMYSLPYLSDNQMIVDHMTFEPYYMQRPNITQRKKVWF